MDDRYPEPIDFTAILNPRKKPKCVFRIDNGPIIGNPFAHPDRCAVSLNIDGGRFGQPSLGLEIKITRLDPHGKPIPNAATVTEDVKWYPGVKMFDQYMMEHLKYADVTQLRGNAKVWPQEILAKLPKGHHEPNLLCVAFQSNSHATHVSTLNTWDGINEKTRNGLSQLFSTSGSYQITIWFVGKGLPRGLEFVPNCFGFFVRAYQQRLPPLHQYMAADGKPNLSLDMDPILEFRNGMYCNWARDRATGQIDTK